MSQLRAIIFDVDGTLADTERDGHRIAFNRAFADAGLDWEWSVDLYGELLEVTGGKERIRFYLDKHQPDFQPPDDLDGLIAGLHVAKTQHYQQILAGGGIPLRTGVRRLLEEARSQGVRLAIATTTAAGNTTALLQSAIAPDAPNWFEIIAAGDIVPAKKPAPDIYNYVLKKMDLTPQECLVIEDSYQGLTAAMAAGLKTVITVNGYTRNHNLTGAVLAIDHLGEPDQPFTVLAGDPLNATYFDLAIARHLHSQ